MIDNRLKRIYYHFGAENQLAKLAEECAEFLEKYLKGDIDGAMLEIPDVNCISSQFILVDKYLEDILHEKVERTLNRIATRYYEKTI